jgi:glycosyltransferase involved in cell wall biosynthesis
LKTVLYVTYFFHSSAMRAQGIVSLLPARGVRPVILCCREWTDEAIESKPSTGSINPIARTPESAAPGERADGSIVLATPDPLQGLLRRLHRLRRADPPSGPASRPGRASRPTASSGSTSAANPIRPAGRNLWEELLAFPDRNALWIPSALLAGWRAAGKYSVEAVYASSGPVSGLFVGWILARCLRRPLLAEFRDLWVDNPFLRYRLPLHRRIDRFWENRILRSAARVVVVTTPMKERLLRVHPHLPPDRIAVVPNGFDPDVSWGVLAPGNGAPSGPSRPRVLTYTGELYGQRSPAALLGVLESWRAENGGRHPIKVRFVGRIDRAYQATVDHAVRTGLAERRDVCSLAESLEEMRRADALLLLIENGPGADGIMTGKIFPYLASGKPILGLVPESGVAARLLREAGGSLVIDPDDPEAIAQGLYKFVHGEIEMPPPAHRRSVLARYTWPALSGEIAEILLELCQSVARRGTPAPIRERAS